MTEVDQPLAVGVGESLLRLSTPGHERLGQASQLQLHVGGAEMNALISAVAHGLQARWVTRLADNPLGRRIATHAAAHGLDLTVDWDAESRAPLYFVEHGYPPRPSEVLYDRDGSAMRRLSSETFDLAEIVAGAAVVLSSGITCALGAGPAQTVGRLFEQVRAGGALTAFDVNHRSRMWSWDEAARTLQRILPDVDVLFASRYDLSRVLGGTGTAADATQAAREAIRRFGHQFVVLRETAQTGTASVEVSVQAVTVDDHTDVRSYQAGVVDPFGAGDAAVGALLARLVQTKELARAVEEAAWACAFQHTVPGDAWQGRPGDGPSGDERSRRILR